MGGEFCLDIEIIALLSPRVDKSNANASMQVLLIKYAIDK